MTAGRPLWLDITRLLERACVGTFTGIDRVELAYAENLIALAPERVRFVMLGRWSGRFSVFPNGAARRFLLRVRRAWADGRPRDVRAAALRLLAMAAIAPSAPFDDTAIYLLVSHRHLHRQTALRRALHRSGTAFVPFIHDLIPLEFPEYGRTGEANRHRRRVATVVRLADGIIVNSAATGTALAPYLPAGHALKIAPLGITLPALSICPTVADRPYFVCVGTIEPRKNHLLLLHLWRRLIAKQGQQTPRLLLIGQRGWENGNVLDLLDRCITLRSHVIELGTVPDTRLAALLRGARALLMPSFAEGFGLPVAEALAHGTPVLCSDLPALREAGGIVPEYLDPLDAPAWTAAVLDYTLENSSRRDAQIGRLPGWRGATWDAHVGSVLDFVDGLQPRARARPVPFPSAPTSLRSVERQPHIVLGQ